MNYKISMLVPTRNRPLMLPKFVQSVYQMTHHKKNINIYFICDEDDTQSKNYVKIIMDSYKSQIEMTLLTRPRSEMLNEDYYNWAARQTTGDLIWVLADDLEIVSPGWDEAVQTEVSKFYKDNPDRVVCLSIRDNTPPPSHRIPKFPCFPMLSREAMLGLGNWILHPKVPTWGADYITYCIFEPIGKLVQLHEKNYINHISWHTKQCAVDETNQRIGAIFNKLKMVPHHNTDRIIEKEVPQIRLELLQYIKEHQGV